MTAPATTTIMTTILRVILLVGLLALGASAAHSAEIALRQSARVAPDAPLTLGDVADLRGEDALALRHVRLSPRARDGATRRAWFEVSVQEVREALEREGVNWGRVALTGSSCLVRLVEERAEPEAEAQAGVPVAPADRAGRATRIPTDVSPGDGSTVQAHAVRALMRLFAVEASDLRVAFDPSDDALLETRVWGRRVDVQPGASGVSSRITLSVWVYEGERVVASGTLRADVEVRRDAIVVVNPLRRGGEITPVDVRPERLWVAPGGAPLLTDLNSVVGSRARTRVGVGAMLRSDHIETPIVVRRNDLVTVHCVSGGIVIRTPARAQADAREGDVIEFRIDRTRRPFLARVGGPGIAVMLADDELNDTTTGDDA